MNRSLKFGVLRLRLLSHGHDAINQRRHCVVPVLLLRNNYQVQRDAFLGHFVSLLQLIYTMLFLIAMFEVSDSPLDDKSIVFLPL